MLALNSDNSEETIEAEVVEIRQETPDVKTFRLKPEKELDFAPGQFIFIYPLIDNEKLKRAYSIASSPLEKNFIEITLKEEQNGKVSTYMNEKVKTGEVFEISMPTGKFIYTDELKDIVLIAGGSGIVPFRSMIRYFRQKNLDTNITLFYSTRAERDIIYRKELDSYASDKVKVLYTITRDENWKGRKGRLDAQFISENLNNPTDRTYFLCGPLEFIRAITAILEGIGVSKERIKKDVWS